MAKQKHDYKPYPAHQGSRCGCKVSWQYYDLKKDAEIASAAASHNGDILWEQGYDFGYQSPGHMTLCTEGDYAGKWMVVIP